eukprot:CAMPEP_0194685592 /NCGR_PEP_ID=MMETSP0295-20121207/14918_1 /TAXON_ID=39354 /ORGANISM="Heterosigma akashiwo, Strain CCMP2393" /LENGTH=62 /DNA_ID=CAMNT_0039573093 /DNA_START=654 /DNA_END=842 /DNA_ORIENTATION=+
MARNTADVTEKNMVIGKNSSAGIVTQTATVPKNDSRTEPLAITSAAMWCLFSFDPQLRARAK